MTFSPKRPGILTLLAALLFYLIKRRSNFINAINEAHSQCGSLNTHLRPPGSRGRELGLGVGSSPCRCCGILSVAAAPARASISAARWKNAAQIRGAPNRTDISAMTSPTLRYDPNEEFVRLISQLQQATGMFSNQEAATKLKSSPHPRRRLLDATFKLDPHGLCFHYLRNHHFIPLKVAEAGAKQIFPVPPSHGEPHTLLLFQSRVSVPPTDAPCPLAYQAAGASPSCLATPLALLGLHMDKPKHTPRLTDPCPVLPHPSCSKSDHGTRRCRSVLGPASSVPRLAPPGNYITRCRIQQ